MMEGAQYKMHIEIPSEIGQEKRAVQKFNQFVKKYDIRFPDNKIDKLQTIVTEAVLNAIEHGNKNDVRKKVCVRFKICSKYVFVHVVDQGIGFKTCSPPSIKKKLFGDERPRGWGIHLIKAFADNIKFGYKQNFYFSIMLKM